MVVCGRVKVVLVLAVHRSLEILLEKKNPKGGLPLSLSRLSSSSVKVVEVATSFVAVAVEPFISRVLRNC